MVTTGMRDPAATLRPEDLLRCMPGRRTLTEHVYGRAAAPSALIDDPVAEEEVSDPSYLDDLHLDLTGLLGP